MKVCFHRADLTGLVASGELGKCGSSSERRTCELELYLHIGRWQEELKGSFYSKGTCGLWYHSSPSFIYPSSPFPQTLRRLRKSPFLSCSLLHSEPNTELRHRPHTSRVWESLAGGDEGLAGSPQWPTAPRKSPAAPATFSAEIPSSSSMALTANTFLLWLAFLFGSVAGLPQNCFIFSSPDVSATVFWAWGPEHYL